MVDQVKNYINTCAKSNLFDIALIRLKTKAIILYRINIA